MAIADPQLRPARSSAQRGGIGTRHYPKTKHRSETAPVLSFSRPPFDAAAYDGFWRLHFLETQKAPSRIAPTKTNAAHTARTLSFIVRPTRRTSITVFAGFILAECGTWQKQISCCIAASRLVRNAFGNAALPTP
jgi:hypothetical protein